MVFHVAVILALVACGKNPLASKSSPNAPDPLPARSEIVGLGESANATLSHDGRTVITRVDVAHHRATDQGGAALRLLPATSADARVRAVAASRLAKRMGLDVYPSLEANLEWPRSAPLAGRSFLATRDAPRTSRPLAFATGTSAPAAVATTDVIAFHYLIGRPERLERVETDQGIAHLEVTGREFTDVGSRERNASWKRFQRTSRFSRALFLALSSLDDASLVDALRGEGDATAFSSAPARARIMERRSQLLGHMLARIGEQGEASTLF